MTTCTKARVFIAQPEPVVNLGLGCLINEHEQLEVCGEAVTASQTRDLCELHQPDVVIVDTDMDGGGTNLLRDVKRWAPPSRVVVFTGSLDALLVQRALAAGALGYVTRMDSATDVLTTILRALRGQRHLGRLVEILMLEHIAQGRFEMPGNAVAGLSERELQIFHLIGKGKGLRAIADELHVSVKTIETHRHRIKNKLNLPSGADLQRSATLYCHRNVDPSHEAC